MTDKIKNIAKKYNIGDDDFSKEMNRIGHLRKQKGIKQNKGEKSNTALRKYIDMANQKLGRRVHIYEKGASWDSPNPQFGINWSAIGTVSIPETKQFIDKLQQAIDFIQKAPKSSGDKKNPF